MRCNRFVILSGVLFLLFSRHASAQNEKQAETNAGDKAICACLCAIIDDLEKLKPDFPELSEFSADRLKADVELGPHLEWTLLNEFHAISSESSESAAEKSTPQKNPESASKWFRGFRYQHHFTEGSPKYVSKKPEFGENGCRFFVQFRDLHHPSQRVANGTIPALNVQYFYLIQLSKDGRQELQAKFDEILNHHIDQLKKGVSEPDNQNSARKEPEH
ncbi:MAG TPA: hypothetical protein PLI09_24950 [Candidatus Hydrogenedentes bacterium]|nr:hypothetical protein [Candidatus Hydrogenedentota bacterium]